MSEVRSAKIDVGIGYEQRADAAAAAVLRRLLGVVQDNLEGALVGENPEYLHQLRIAVRRSRTVQRQFHGIFPGLELPGLRADFRWLQRGTGAARDLDVQLEDFDGLAELVPKRDRGELEPVRQRLLARRERALASLSSVLRSGRALALFEDWERLLESLVELPIDDRPDARRSVGSLTGERILAVYERIVKRGRKLDATSPGERFHDLRKTGKELRYLLELFGAPLFAADAVDPLVGSLKAMQSLLGRHQDREVQAGLLRDLAGELAPGPEGARACLATGILLARLEDDELAARREFAERYAELASERQRARIAELLS